MRKFALFALIMVAGCSSPHEAALPSSTTTTAPTTSTTIAPTTTTTVFVPPPTTTTRPAHISSAEAAGALTEAFATALPGYQPTAQDIELFRSQTLAGGDTRLAAVGFVSQRYAATIQRLRDQAAAREQEHRIGCVMQTFDEMMSGTTVVGHENGC